MIIRHKLRKNRFFEVTIVNNISDEDLFKGHLVHINMYVQKQDGFFAIHYDHKQFTINNPIVVESRYIASKNLFWFKVDFKTKQQAIDKITEWTQDWVDYHNQIYENKLLQLIDFSH